ncbi:MAG: hypothetical protein LC808_24100 [Actinobacteria bacterium]|nr:hypothetical protein [Actinomycetota bacterium]
MEYGSEAGDQTLRQYRIQLEGDGFGSFDDNLARLPEVVIDNSSRVDAFQEARGGREQAKGFWETAIVVLAPSILQVAQLISRYLRDRPTRRATITIREASGQHVTRTFEATNCSEALIARWMEQATGPE